MEVGLYASHRLREHTRQGALLLERHWFETAVCRPCLGQSRVSDIRAADVSVQICFEEAVTVFGICLTCQVEELVLVPHVLKEYHIFSV